MKSYKEFLQEQEKSDKFPSKICKSCTNYAGDEYRFCDQSHWGLSKDGKTCEDYDKVAGTK